MLTRKFQGTGFVVLFFAMAMVVLMPVIAPVLNLATVVIPSNHAVDRHGMEALAIRNCFEDNGDYQVWRNTFNHDKFYHICQLEDNVFGIQVVCMNNAVCNEVTAFIKGDGSMRELIAYLRNRATIFTAGLP